MALSHNPKIVTDGLVLCLDAANPKSYPGSGTTWYDLSGNGNDGTLVNGVGYDSANNGSMVFDGSNDYISFNTVNTNSPNITSNTWCYIHNFYEAQNSTIGIHIDSGRNNGGFRIYARSNFFGVWFRSNELSGTPSFSQDNYILPTNNWINIVMLNQNRSIKFFVNNENVLNGSINGDPNEVNGNAWISRYSGGGYYFDGNLSHTSIYNRALTESEIKQNFNALRGRYNL